MNPWVINERLTQCARKLRATPAESPLYRRNGRTLASLLPEGEGETQFVVKKRETLSANLKLSTNNHQYQIHLTYKFFVPAGLTLQPN